MRHLMRLDDDRTAIRAWPSEVSRVWHDALWFYTLTVKAELADCQLPAPAGHGCQMLKGTAPDIEPGLIKIRSVQAHDDKALEAPKDPLSVAVIPSLYPLMGEPSGDPFAQGR